MFDLLKHPLKKAAFFCFTFFVFMLCACEANGESAIISPDEVPTVTKKSSSSYAEISSNSKDTSNVDSLQNKLKDFVTLKKIPSGTLFRGDVAFKVNSFFMADIETTQKFYKEFLGEVPLQNNPGDSLPVVNVTWENAVLFCNLVSKFLKLDTAYIFEGSNVIINYDVQAVRLPTEAEWEWAARAYTTTKYYWGEKQASLYAYYGMQKGPTKVGSYLPNDFKIFDIAGNVAEWTNDWYGPYPTQASENYSGADFGDFKIIRGGNWSDTAKELALNVREKKTPTYKSGTVGFRIIISNI